MHLRPLLITRLANVLPGFLPVGLGVENCLDATEVRYRVGAVVLATAGLVLSARGYRMGVRCGRTLVTVRGFFLSRTIPRSSIRSITPLPAIRWTARSGRSRWTPIIAFVGPAGIIATVERHNDTAAEALTQWWKLGPSQP